jgi:hypothetical protein
MTMTGATLTIDLDETANYSGLLLRFSWTADVSQIDATKERIADWVTGISVVGDDDKYVINATARELCALAFYRTGVAPLDLPNNTDNSTNILELPILFGRHLGDQEYYLKGGQFSKLEVNITNGDSATGDYFDAGTVEVIGYQLKDVTKAPTGVFRFKEVKSWTPSTSTDTHTEDLTEKNKIEKIIVEAQPAYVARTSDFAANYDTLLDKLKLTLKSGDIVIFDDDVEKLMRQNLQEFGYAYTQGDFTGQDADYIDSGLGFVAEAKATMEGATAIDTTALTTNVIGFVNANTQRLQVEQSLAGDVLFQWNAKGGAYMDTVCFDFLKYGLLDAPALKKVQVGLTAGSTAGTIKIAVSELVTGF